MTLAALLAEIDRRIAAFGADQIAYTARGEEDSAFRVAAHVNALRSLRQWVDARPAPASRVWVVEGVWSGYTSVQRRVCHRTLERTVGSLGHVSAVLFSDGTLLELTVRPRAPREKVAEIHGYDELLRRVAASGLTGVVSVVALAERRKAGATDLPPEEEGARCPTS